MKCQNNNCEDNISEPELFHITVRVTETLSWDVTILVCSKCYDIWAYD